MGQSIGKHFLEKSSLVKEFSIPTSNQNVPLELLLDIVPFLPRNEVEKCQLVCSRWHDGIYYNPQYFSLRSFRYLVVHSSNKIFYLSRDYKIVTSSKFKSIIKKLRPGDMKNCIIEEFSYLNLKPKEEHSIDALCKNLQTVIKLFGGKIRAIDSHMAVKDHEVFIEKFGDYLMTDRLGLKDADKLIFNPNLLNYYSNSQMYLSCTHKFINDANYHSTPTSEIHSLDEFFNFAIKAGKNCSLAFKQYEQQIPLKIFIEKYFQVVKNSENPSNFAGKIKFNTSNVEYEKFQTKWVSSNRFTYSKMYINEVKHEIFESKRFHDGWIVAIIFRPIFGGKRSQMVECSVHLSHGQKIIKLDFPFYIFNF